MSTIPAPSVDTLDTKLMELGASDRVSYQQMLSLARALEGQLSVANTRIASILWSGVLDDKTCGKIQEWVGEYQGELNQARAELTAARAECAEQARLNGMGGEREAGLLSQVALLRAALERRHSEQSYHCGYVDEVLRRTAPRA